MKWSIPAAGLVALISACHFEHAPRSGPLAQRADSVLPHEVPATCQDPIDRIPSQPPYRVCRQDGRAAPFLYLGRDGRVLGVVEYWPEDSGGRARAAALKGEFTALTGRAAERGEEDNGSEEYIWRTDSTCYNLFRAKDSSGYQLSVRLPEFYYGHC